MNAHSSVMRRALQLCLFVGMLLGLALLRPAPVAYAATFIVSDCSAPSGPGRLVTQIAAAAPGDTIKFYCSGTITLTAGISIDKNLTIDGGGQSVYDLQPVTISGGGSVIVMTVSPGISLTLNNLTIANGKGGGDGGGVYNNGGALTITNSTFSGNAAGGAGGGVYNNGGTTTITNSTFSGNSAAGTGGGGGVYVQSGTVTITNSTFSGNSATYASANGAAVKNLGTLTLANTIVANSTAGANCGGAITNGGNNIDDGASCGWGSAHGSMSSTNPQLGSLADNGGPTQTFALLTGSPALNGVTYSAPNGCPSTDQRGWARPIGAGYDIGAYEYQSGIMINVTQDCFALSNEPPGDLISKLDLAGYGDDNLYQVLVAIKNNANPSVENALPSSFMAALAACPPASEIFTTKLKDVDMPGIAVEVCTNGLVQFRSVSGSSSATQGFPTLVSNISGVGTANFTYSTDPNVHLASWAVKSGMITTTYHVFGVAWGQAMLYLPLILK